MQNWLGFHFSRVSDISPWLLLDTKEAKFIIVLFQLKMRLNKWELRHEDISKFILKKDPLESTSFRF